MTIYFGIQPDRLQDAALLINLFFSQLINVNLRELPQDNPALKYQCTLVDDEFAAVGKIGVIDKANAYIAGYNLRLLTIIQAVSQLEHEKLYGIHGTRTLVTNHALQILFPPKEAKDAKEYSEMLGYFTATAKGRGRSRGKSSSTSTSFSDQKRALMMPQELKEMPQDEQIITLESTKPIRCEKAFFYRDHLFIDRLKALSPFLAALGKKLPSQEQLEHAAFALGDLQIDVKALDVQALWLASSKPTPRPVKLRAIRPDEIANLKASDIANYEELKQSLYRILPGFALVEKTMADITGPALTASASS
jgi:type IV secretion system protein VirD4